MCFPLVLLLVGQLEYHPVQVVLKGLVHWSGPGGLWTAGAKGRHHAAGGLRHHRGPGDDRVRWTPHRCPPGDGGGPR